MSSLLRFSLALVCCSLAALATAAEIRVAPGEGALTRARSAAREARRTQPDEPVTVLLGTGDYFLRTPLDFSAEDSGITWRAAEGATPRLIGARKLAAAQFTSPTSTATLLRIAPAARGQIVALDLRALSIRHAKNPPSLFTGHGDLLDLFIDGRRLQIARFPNLDTGMTIRRVLDDNGGNRDSYWSVLTAAQKSTSGSLGGVFEYREEFAEAHARWAAAVSRGVWLQGYWSVSSQIDAVRVHAIDPKQRTVTLSKPVPGGIGNKHYRPEGNGRERYWLFNLLEEIDEPGEWCVDFVDQKLYLFPPLPLDRAEILLADNSDPLIRVTGTSNFTLRGLTIEANLGPGIEVKGGDHVLVAGCTVRNVDGYAVVLDGGTEHAVQSCDLYNLGAGGVWLGGGNDRRTPRVAASHRVDNNHIHHFGVIERVFAPGVNSGFTGGAAGGHHTAVGMFVGHNLIHDAPHGAVLVGSWDNIFECNEVFRYGTVSNDLGAFYSSDQFARSGGHTFGSNLMHSAEDGDGIVFDQDHRDMTLFGNIAFFQSSGSGKHGTAFLYKKGPSPNTPQQIDCRNNVAIACRTGFSFVSPLPSTAVIANNVAIACEVPFLWRSVTAEGRESAATAPTGYPANPNVTYAFPAEAGFLDVARHDFHQRADAKVFRDLPGFSPIVVEKIGLYVDEYRRVLPTSEAIDRFGTRAAADTGLHYDETEPMTRR